MYQLISFSLQHETKCLGVTSIRSCGSLQASVAYGHLGANLHLGLGGVQVISNTRFSSESQRDLVKSYLESIPALKTDPEKVVQVLDILLSNAVKYTGAKGTITITRELKNHKVVFCVCDNGPGIEPNKLKYVFDRFYRTDESRNTPGSGLGLAITDETMRGLDEKIWAESEPGNGSRFYFTVSLN